MLTRITSKGLTLIELALIALFLAMFYTSTVRAQPQMSQDQQAEDSDIIFRTGSNDKNVYHILYTQMKQVCQKPTISYEYSNGSIASLDALINNQANLAFVQTDVLYGRKTIENDAEVDTVRTFMPLYSSELHMLALRSNQRINAFSDFDSKKIGAYGGAYVTARILLAKAGIRPFNIQQLGSIDEGFKSLQAGTIDVLFTVVGQPDPSIQALNGTIFKLITFDRIDVLPKIGNFYSQTNLRYQNLSTTTVKSVGVQIDLVTRDYKSQKIRSDLSELKNCLITNIDNLRDRARNHPKWREIKPEATTEWPPMFQTVGMKATPAKKKK